MIPRRITLLGRYTRLVTINLVPIQIIRHYTTGTSTNTEISTDKSKDATKQSKEKLEKLSGFLSKVNQSSSLYKPNEVLLNSEEDIVRTFLGLVDISGNTEVPEGDAKVWQMLHEKQGLKELPKPPRNFNSLKLNEYIEQVSHVQTRANRKLRNEVRSVYWEVLKAGLLENIDSYNIILRFFAVNYNFKAVKAILLSMYQAGIRPNISTFNCIISPLKYSRNKYKNDLLKMYLTQMKVYHLVPDRTTWYILFKFLEKKKLFFYEQMLRMNIPTKPIICDVLEYLPLARKFNVEDMLVWLKSQGVIVDKRILTSLVRVCIELDDPSKAFEVLDRFVRKDKTVKRVDFNSLIALVNYFANTKKQLYNSLATINYFMDNYGLTIKVYRSYETLIRSMLSYPYFKHWSVLTRRFYLDTMYAMDQSIVSPRCKRELEKKADEFGIEDFQLDKLKREEFNETAEVFSKLRWSDKPILKLEENTPEFIEAAKYVTK